MKDSVLYLCQSLDAPERFVFANELPEHHYSPGIFIVEAANRSGTLKPTFNFPARKGVQVMNLELRRVDNGRAYVVDAASNGMFYFKVIALNRNARYSGQRGGVFHDFPLYRLEPANMRQLERACLEHDFYFTGSAGFDADYI